jgi:hypothetical protein
MRKSANVYVGNIKNKNMAEEDITAEPTITSEDFDALRVLMHNVKGLSVVSGNELSLPEQAPEE